MTPDLVARILRLPEPIRAKLATVEGSGWMISPRGNALLQAASDPPLIDGYTWWSANPAASVAAVTSMPSWWAHQQIGNWLYDREPDADDHEAAICIIEARAARSTT